MLAELCLVRILLKLLLKGFTHLIQLLLLDSVVNTHLIRIDNLLNEGSQEGKKKSCKLKKKFYNQEVKI